MNIQGWDLSWAWWKVSVVNILLKAPADVNAKIKQTSPFSSSHAVSYVFVIKHTLRLFSDLNYANNPENINCLRG